MPLAGPSCLMAIDLNRINRFNVLLHSTISTGGYSGKPLKQDTANVLNNTSTFLPLGSESTVELALDDLTHQRNWHSLSEHALAYADYLHSIGMKPGDHAAILMHNRVDYIEIVLGALLAGVWITPVNWHLTPAEIRYVLKDCEASVVFTEKCFQDLVESLGSVEVFCVEERWAILAALRTKGKAFDPNAQSGGVMIYTSGTTGQPKGVKRAKPNTVRELLDGYRQSGMSIGLDGKSHLITGPLYHAAPLLYALYDLVNGATLIIMPNWDAELALRLIQNKQINHSHWVPTMFYQCLALPEVVRQSYDLTSLSLVLHGAAPITIEQKRRMIAWWGSILVEYWGGTEGGVCTMVNTEDWLAHPGTVGQALPQFDVYAVSEQSDEVLPAGRQGLLYTRYRHSNNVFEYYNDSEKTAAAFRDRSSFTLGDIGHVDAEGYVFLCDRKSNMIISGGVNIYPQEVEQRLLLHEAIADVLVFGEPDEQWGETVSAAVELSANWNANAILKDELLQFCQQKLARYKLPKTIYYVNELPRSPAGKISLRRLREQLSLNKVKF